MQAGRLRHRLTIQNFTTSRTPSGQPVEKWEDGKTIWAEVKGISGRELLAAGVE
ncbi:phage head closure protein, partial [Klebsiella oxytoca]|uniref:phage head closure protein n=3 Tax=Klebsiella/Raoultella group TaxID=2890311 RepID=UPI001C8DDB17